jgi:hypothetical protein
MRVLQTLALPLGHDALYKQRGLLTERLPIRNPPCLSGRWDSNPRPSPWQGDVLPLYYAREHGQPSTGSAETQDRTGDTAIFSRVLYQLSYLGDQYFLLSVRDFTRTYMDCQEKLRLCSSLILIKVLS